MLFSFAAFGKNGLESRTFRVQLLMHIRMILLQPFLAFLRRAAKLAILVKGAWRISLIVPLAGGVSSPRKKSKKTGRAAGIGRITSGGREQTGCNQRCIYVSASGFVAGRRGFGGRRCTTAVDDVPGARLCGRCFWRGCVGHCVWGEREVRGWRMEVW